MRGRLTLGRRRARYIRSGGRGCTYGVGHAQNKMNRFIVPEVGMRSFELQSVVVLVEPVRVYVYNGPGGKSPGDVSLVGGEELDRLQAILWFQGTCAPDRLLPPPHEPVPVAVRLIVTR